MKGLKVDEKGCFFCEGLPGRLFGTDDTGEALVLTKRERGCCFEGAIDN